MAEPVTDPEALGQRLYELWDDPPDTIVDHDAFTATAVAIRDAVCPPATHVVVPRAMIEKIGTAIAAYQRQPFGSDEFWLAMNALDEARQGVTESVALGKEPTDG